MYLLCVKCLNDSPDGQFDIDKAKFYLGKYYPSSGWCTNPGLGKAFDEFMEKHKHGGLTGRYFTVLYDGWFDEIAKARDTIAERVSRLVMEEAKDASDSQTA